MRPAPTLGGVITGDPMAALDRLLAATSRGEIDTICERHRVELLGVFGSAVRHHYGHNARPPRDLDVAVSFAGSHRPILELLDDLVAITDYDGIDLAVLDGANPVLRAEALTGIGLYERTGGAWATAQMAALAERRDTAHLRRLDLQALAG
ncbi:MAG: nucleotidyltransferase family protein [Acidimicrobiales bacterium]